MKKIVRLHGFGGPQHLKIDEVAFQPLKAGEARISITAACISRDNHMLFNANLFARYGFPVPALPSKLGYEASGIVTEVGEGVDTSWIGKRVAPFFGIDEIEYGMLGEEAVIPASFLVEYPSNLNDEQAAAIWVPFLTAYGGFVNIANVSKGDFVVITAAASSVGLASIQMVKDLGAVPIAVIRSANKREKLLEAGAEHVIVTNDEDYVERVQNITGGLGAGVTFDPISGPFLDQVIAGAAYGGIVIQYGMLSNEPVKFPLKNVMVKNLSIRGYTVGSLNAHQGEDAKKYILERLADGRFTPSVAKVFKLDQIQEAYAFLNSSEQFGRVVISTK